MSLFNTQKPIEMSRKNMMVLKIMSYASAVLVVVLLVAGSLAAQHAQLQRRVTTLTVLSQNIPLLAENAMMGRTEAFDNLAIARGKLSATLEEVKRADPVSSALGNPQFQVLSELTKWDALLVQSLDVLKVRRTTEELQRARIVVRERNTQLLKSLDILANQAGPAWAKSFEPLKLQFRLQVPALEGDLEGMADGKLTERETQLLVDKRLQFMNDVITHLNGEDRGFGAPPVPLHAQPALRQVDTMLQAVEGQVQATIPLGAGLAAAHIAKQAVMDTGLSLSASMRKVEQAGDQSFMQVFSRPWLLMALLSGTILMLVGSILTQRMLAANRGAAEKRQEQNERNQRAIVRLLGEIENLAKGDLTVNATVNEDITGAIADSINYTIGALRRLVLTIQQSATQMDSSVRKTQLVAIHLSESAAVQAKQVASASASAAAVAASTRHVSGNAERSAEVALQSVELAHRGGEAVRRTIDGMNAIRENIQETSKRIKRLGESSQEIGNIVELINDIADQTNVLALNASIQASAAGEAGRGFAVVADEVQRLAERAARATRQIDMLVRGIQADTSEAVVSMERTTTDVVGGALLAENAGHALDEIEQVSSQISSLVQGISLSAQEQASAAQNIAQNMRALHDISTETMRSVTDTTDSITHLTDLAGHLHKSVAEFKVPTIEVGKDPGDTTKQPLRFRHTRGKATDSAKDSETGGEVS